MGAKASRSSNYFMPAMALSKTNNSFDASTWVAEGLSPDLTTNMRRSRPFNSASITAFSISSSRTEICSSTGGGSSMRALATLNSHWRTSLSKDGTAQLGKSRMSFAMHHDSRIMGIGQPQVPRAPGLIQQSNIAASAHTCEG
ncbi:conserved hypothetical protein [Uncinocarpus reesii 1704]|uniref:Uncharacterized protein n=1 Tax=Uncinocarpus reesii (strain UAMH 1704) TaxID=336963 RepID=C4JH41_UNCRE|nr:uncharacterized protein UREG_01292 [Uncinocarpus reesii 1704]EEP76443.1 conserved hypothetical protein [Uncinocarpus reesii 1704]